MEVIFTMGDDMMKMEIVLRRGRQNGVTVDDQCQQCAALTPNAILNCAQREKAKLYLAVYVSFLGPVSLRYIQVLQS